MGLIFACYNLSMNTPHVEGCPDINCNNNKDCCPFRKIVIPSVMGDDSEESPAAPENGMYRNALVEYEANGAMYIYASDGIFTKISMIAGGSGAASVQYVDGKIGAEATARQNGDADTLAAANAYTDAHSSTGGVTQQYVDEHDASTLNNAKNYADSIKPTKTSDLTNNGAYGDSTYVEADELASVATSGAYSDLIGAPSLAPVATSGDYSSLSGTPSLAAVATSGSYSDLTDTPSLASVATSGAYSDLTGTPALATVATSGAYDDLIGTPTVPTITMTTTDPGEGSPLAANNFIGVYQ